MGLDFEKKNLIKSLGDTKNQEINAQLFLKLFYNLESNNLNSKLYQKPNA